jgi:hypothetical protein
MDSEIQKHLREPFHPSLVKKNYAGFDHIQGHTAIDRLIQATGETGWSFFISDTRVFHDASGKVVHVAMLGSLDIGNQRRSDWGEAHTANKPGEELFKSAQTDTIKRCARMFGVALELYGDMIDDATGEHVGRPQHANPGYNVARPTNAGPVDIHQPTLTHHGSIPRPSNGGSDTGRKTYPTVGQLKIAEPSAKAAGLDWSTQADDIIFAALGKAGPLYRNDEFQDVVLWMQQHAGNQGQWSYDQEGRLVLGPAEPVAAGERFSSIDEVPWE